MDIDTMKDLRGRVTPGPWTQSTMFGPTNVCVEVEGSIRSVAACGGYQRSGPLAETASMENRANADLIAMALDLLDAVIHLTAELDTEKSRGAHRNAERLEALNCNAAQAQKIVRLTSEHAQVVAANRVLATENARLVKRDAKARELIGLDPWDIGYHEWTISARAFLAGEGK